ncbi:MAG TPA: MmcQ/YjbR family DNA-binding protein [Bradyrhizobium sp.]|nr:MmcQ/YjbR family DNA-binding protein [Bradyrhizobium sp.]
MAISKADFRKIALSFPEASEKPSYGKPSFFIAKKFFTRLRDEDDSIVWIVGSIDERDHLLEMDSKTYFITEHYRDYPAVLVRTARIDKAMLRKMLERRFRAIAPKRVLKEMDAQATAPKKLQKENSDSLVIPGERRKAARGKKTQLSKSGRR